MRAAVGTFAVATALLLSAQAATAQPQPLRKTDLVRLLTVGGVPRREIAEIVRRHCVTFAPTARDRADLRGIGADTTIMRRIDECARRVPAAGRMRSGPAQPSGSRPQSSRSEPGPSRSVGVRPRASPSARGLISPERTAFVSGGGQRGRVGGVLPLPVVFEVRDTTNAAVPGQEVRFTATNARVAPERAVTDATGQIRLTVVLGARAQPATIRARMPGLERQVSVLAVAGPPVEVVVRCGAEIVRGRVLVRSGAAARLEIEALDGAGNAGAVTPLRAAVGDQGLVRLAGVTADGTRGILTLNARGQGSTTLDVFASGLRENVTVTVTATGPLGCRL